MNLTAEMPIAFTAQSKRYFYCRDVICAFTLQNCFVPLNPFRVFEFFLDDRVDRDLVRRGNFNLIRKSDELWVFGHRIADGVFNEIKYARHLGKPIRFYSIGTRVSDIHPISFEDLQFENEIYKPGKSLTKQEIHERKKIQLLNVIMEHKNDQQGRLFS